MQIDENFVLQTTGLTTLTEIARRAAGRDDLELGAWRVASMAGGLGNPVSAGLFCVAGAGRAAGEPVEWSAVLKVIQSPANVGYSDIGESDDMTHWNYWRRELLLYRSGFLDTLPDGLVAPRFYGAGELPGDVAYLWLEEVSDDYPDGWPLERYALAARHLGRLNGAHVGGQPWPQWPWLSRGRLWQWFATLTEWRTLSWEHPAVSGYFPAAEVGTLRRLLWAHEEFLTRLDRLPQTVSHGDTYPTNFKARRLAAGREETVALDWALAGVCPIGYDLGSLAFGAYLNRPEATLTKIDDALFTSYLDGLRDAGCRIDANTVRFGYTAAAALSFASLQFWMLGVLTTRGHTGPVDLGRRGFEAAMAEWAWELWDGIH